MLADFERDGQLRMAKVEYQLDNLGTSADDIVWGKAYDEELEAITNQLSMVTEETRMLNVKIRYCDDRVQELLLELEDIELDMDENSMSEVQEFELLRRMELERCRKQAKDRFDTKVRRERCKWHVADVRRNVIRRTRTDLEKYKETVQQFEPKEVLTTLSFKKRRDWLKDEAELVKELERKATKKSAKEMVTSGQENKNIRETYDAIMSGCLEVLKANSFVSRRGKSDMREDPIKMERLWPKELKNLPQLKKSKSKMASNDDPEPEQAAEQEL